MTSLTLFYRNSFVLVFTIALVVGVLSINSTYDAARSEAFAAKVSDLVYEEIKGVASVKQAVGTHIARLLEERSGEQSQGHQK